MAHSDYSNYFTVVIYPEEFTRYNLLLELGYIYQSPVHYAKKIEYTFNNSETTQLINTKNDWVLYGVKHDKPHQHLLIKTSNRMTENKFIEKLSLILSKDFTGIAIKKGETFVYKPEIILRYFYHLDNPNKEHFNILTAFESVPPCFTKEVAKAFEVEITHIITENILLGTFQTMRDIIAFNSCSLVFEEYMRCTKNLYYIRNFFLDERYLEKRRKELNYEEVTNIDSIPAFCKQV